MSDEPEIDEVLGKLGPILDMEIVVTKALLAARQTLQSWASGYDHQGQFNELFYKCLLISALLPLLPDEWSLRSEFEIDSFSRADIALISHKYDALLILELKYIPTGFLADYNTEKRTELGKVKLPQCFFNQYRRTDGSYRMDHVKSAEGHEKRAKFVRELSGEQLLQLYYRKQYATKPAANYETIQQKLDDARIQLRKYLFNPNLKQLHKHGLVIVGIADTFVTSPWIRK